MSNSDARRRARANHHPRIPADEVQLVLRLAGRLQGLDADPMARKRQLLKSLCQLVGAAVGLSVVYQLGREATTAVTVAMWGGDELSRSTGLRVRRNEARVRLVRTIYEGEVEPALGALLAEVRRHGSAVTRTRRQLVADAVWYDCPHVRELRRSAGIDGGIYLAVPLPRGGMAACVNLCRPWGNTRAFSRRDCLVAGLLLEESTWVYDADLPLGSPEVLALPPRQRQTLQYILAGNREREIAERLGVGVSTIHHYVKALHRHFHVSRRGQLLARWDRSYHSDET